MEYILHSKYRFKIEDPSLGDAVGSADHDLVHAPAARIRILEVTRLASVHLNARTERVLSCRFMMGKLEPLYLLTTGSVWSPTMR